MRVRVGRYSYRIRTRGSGRSEGGIADFMANILAVLIVGSLGFLALVLVVGVATVFPPLWILPIGLVVWAITRAKRKRRLKKESNARQLAWTRTVAMSGIESVDQMTGIEFEQKMAVHFRVIGYGVQTTKASGDFGADLILTAAQGQRIVVQLKRYQGSVGVSAVQEAIAARQYYGAHAAMVITNSHLTRPAKELANRADVAVWEREELIRQLSLLQQRLAS